MWAEVNCREYIDCMKTRATDCSYSFAGLIFAGVSLRRNLLLNDVREATIPPAHPASDKELDAFGLI
jgi:hypothetical protein